MEFPYQSTFLRSSLASDPFSLGDVGPEDVLRIESQFPYLFDSSDTNKKGDVEKVAPHTRKLVTVPENRKGPEVSLDSLAKKSVRSAATKSVELNSCKQSQLPPNVFCFSREELRTMLEDVLRNNKVSNYTNSGEESNSNNLRHGKSHSISTISWSGLKNSASHSKSSKCDYKGPQHLANRFALKEMKLSQKKFPKTNEPAELAPQEPYHNPRKKKLVRSLSFSAPGFLKKPLGPQLHRVNSASHLKKENTATFIKPPKKTKSYKAEKVEASSKTNRNTNFTKDISVQCVGSFSGEFTDSSSDSDSRNMEQIFFKGQGKCSSINEVEVPLNNSDSEILKLKLATSLVDKYEKLGLLKKHSVSLKNESYKEENATQSFEKSTSTSSLKKIQSNTSQIRKSFLEDLARDLVYSEVLKHLQNVRIEQGEKSESSSASNSKTNKSVQATSNSHLDENDAFEVRTPQLSLSSSVKQNECLDDDPKDIPVKLSPLTPVTPILSATFTLAGESSSKKTAKKSLQGNDVTDCSEISDFLASDVESKQHSIMEKDDDDHESLLSFATPSLTSTPRNFSYTSKTSKSQEDSKIRTPKYITPEKSSFTSPISNTKNPSLKTESEHKSKQESVVKDPAISRTSTSPPTKTSSIRKQVTSRVAKVSFDIPREISFSEWISDGEVLCDGSKFQDQAKYRSPGEISLSQGLSEWNSPAGSMSVSVSDVTSLSQICSTGEISAGEVL